MKKIKRIIIAILCLTFLGCSIFKKSQNCQNKYTLYPYVFLNDTEYISTARIIVPVRKCSENSDTQYVFFQNLSTLKFNEYRGYTFKQFDTCVIKKIYNAECLDVKSMDSSYSFKISTKEYNYLNPDSLLLKYFKNGEWGLTEEEYEKTDIDTIPSREIWVAFLILFDNNYIISQSCSREFYSIRKAPADDELRNKIKFR